MKKIPVFLVPLFFSMGILLCLSQAAEAQNSMTLTSYYPSPVGAYDRLRLVPRTSEPTCGANTEGMIYYDGRGGFRVLRICRDDGVGGFQWLQFSTPWTRDGNAGALYPSVVSDKVGIGTTNPDADGINALLDVAGIARAQALRTGGANYMVIEGASGDKPGISAFFTDADSLTHVLNITAEGQKDIDLFAETIGIARGNASWIDVTGPRAGNHNAQIIAKSSGSDAGVSIITKGSGKVGINKGDPTTDLDVFGDIQASGTICDKNGCIGSGGVGSVMYLVREFSLGADPPNCPIDWTQLDLTDNVTINGARNEMRTCYRDDKFCPVIYIKRTSSLASDPPLCPAGWTQAAFTKDTCNEVRTCYKCP